jgi:hypothetical protein
VEPGHSRILQSARGLMDESGSSLALGNPRAVVILIVLALHSALLTSPPCRQPVSVRQRPHGRQARSSRLACRYSGIRQYMKTELTLDGK